MADAVQKFQTAKQLGATGELDAATASALGLQDPPVVRCALPQITPELVQSSLFRQTPLENIRANLPYVLNALAELTLGDRDMVGIALATLRTEAACFLPVSEHPCSLNTAAGGPTFGLYANRLGNQGLADAAKYRGRGFIQITGRSNYLEYSMKVFRDDRLLNNPLLAHDQVTAAKVLAHFLKDRESRLRAALQQKKLEDARALVNGGNNGESTFEVAYTAALALPWVQQIQLIQA
jgi:peptidoglycan L-alanyl-D-glutamate endopeptidase CwlK